MAELDAWRVFADVLLSSGDPLGDLLALDLALGASPEPEALRAFQQTCLRHCRASAALSVGWCLGFVRTVAVVQKQFNRFLPNYAFTETARRLVQLFHQPQWQRVEVVFLGRLTMHSLDLRETRSLIEALPPSVRAVHVVPENEQVLAGLRAVLPQRMRLGPSPTPSEDATLVAADRRAIRLPRTPVHLLQRRFGFVSATAQVTRSLSEGYLLSSRRDLAEYGGRSASLIRHGEGHWTIARTQAGALWTSEELHHAERQSFLTSPLLDGGRFDFRGATWEFLDARLGGTMDPRIAELVR